MSFLSFGRVKSVALQGMHGSVLPVAIDFGVSALKLLQLQAGEPPALIAAAQVDTPDSLLNDHAKRLQFQMQALPRLVKSGRFRGRRAACVIPSAHMFCKHMQFPRSEQVELAELVKAAIPAALETLPGALILRHFPVENSQTPGSSMAREGGAKQEVICMAASRDLVMRMMAAIRSAGLEPVGIQPEAIATIKAFELINRRVSDAHLSTLYLDLACGTTKVWIAHGSSLVFAKTIHMGGRDLDNVVARALDLTICDARAKRLAASVLVAPARTVRGGIVTGANIRPAVPAPAPYGSGSKSTVASEGASPGHPAVEAASALADDRRAGQLAPGLTPQVTQQEAAPVAPPEFDLQEPLDTLTDEIAMCTRYYEAMFPGRRLDRAVFFGGEARHRGLCQHIARRIRVSAHVADPLARMARTGKEPCLGVDFTTPQPGWTIPFGLSLCPTDY